jgi:hypothetical protein
MKGEKRPADMSQQQAGELHEPGGNLGLVNLLNRNAELDLDPLVVRRDSVPNNQNGGTTPFELALAGALSEFSSCGGSTGPWSMR